MCKTVRVSILLIASFVLAGSALAQKSPQIPDFIKDYNEGQFALKINKYDKAIAYFTSAIKKNPKFVPAWHARAVAFSKKGEYDRSIADLNQVIKLNPNHLDAYAMMGVVYEIKKDYKSALRVYQAALKRTTSPSVKRALLTWIAQIEEKIAKKK
jgi:tetratricopeptide (TPR) repeat protein